MEAPARGQRRELPVDRFDTALAWLVSMLQRLKRLFTLPLGSSRHLVPELKRIGRAAPFGVKFGVKWPPMTPAVNRRFWNHNEFRKGGQGGSRTKLQYFSEVNCLILGGNQVLIPDYSAGTLGVFLLANLLAVFAITLDAHGSGFE